MRAHVFVVEPQPRCRVRTLVTAMAVRPRQRAPEHVTQQQRLVASDVITVLALLSGGVLAPVVAFGSPRCGGGGTARVVTLL